MDPTVRADMETRLDSDFSDVRIHTGDQAAKSAAAISAQAYAVGNEVVFGQGYFDPASREGRHRLAHELVHVQQQRNGPVSGTDSGDGVVTSDPSDSFEQEADATATRVVAGPPLHDGRGPRDGHQGRPSTRWTGARSVQRCGGMPCDCGHDLGADPGERNDGVVHGPAGTANHWTDCPTTWQPRANAAQTLGAIWVDNVVNGLSLLPKPIPPDVATLLLKHFHTTSDADIAKILGGYKRIQTAIHSSLNFECETSCDPNVLAYVYSFWTHLHLCPNWFSSGADQQADTVIHEIAHDIVGADDNAYAWETAKYNGLSAAKAMNNADSFAQFAWDASKPPTPPPTPPTPPPSGP